MRILVTRERLNVILPFCFVVDNVLRGFSRAHDHMKKIIDYKFRKPYKINIFILVQKLPIKTRKSPDDS